MGKFWMVIKGWHGSSAQKRHDSLDSAKAEAERLCRQQQEDMIILEAVAAISWPHPPLEYTEVK